MKKENFDAELEFRELDLDAAEDVAKLSAWSSRPGEMLPLSLDGLAHHHLSTTAFLRGELAGYGAITVIYSRNVIEFGGLVVNPDLRGYNIGSQLTRRVISQAREEMEPQQILAFANQTSARLFRRLGGRGIRDIATLPAEVWKLCHICPRFEAAQAAGKKCCERVFDVTNIRAVEGS